jgi:hypothetical protein
MKDKTIVDQVFFAGYNPANGSPMTGTVVSAMGGGIYLCRHDAGSLSHSSPIRAETMLEEGWRFFKNKNELQNYLRAAEIIRNNLASQQKQASAETPPPKKPRQVTNKEKPDGKKRQTRPKKKAAAKSELLN